MTHGPFLDVRNLQISPPGILHACIQLTCQLLMLPEQRLLYYANSPDSSRQCPSSSISLSFAGTMLLAAFFTVQNAVGALPRMTVTSQANMLAATSEGQLPAPMNCPAAALGCFQIQ